MKVDQFEVKSINCPLCNYPKEKKLFSKHNFNWVKCLNCKMVYINPQLTDDSISQIYQILYSSKSKSLKKTVQPQHLTILKNLQKLTELKHKSLNVSKLLDVGCFKGDFLNIAKKRGWQVYGTEISEEAINYALNNYEIKTNKGKLTEIDFPKKFFDVVVMNDVLEHLPNPKDYVEKVSKIIKKDGIFYIGTPNFNSLPRVIFGKKWESVIFPWHLQYFTLNTLKKLLFKHGFKIKKISTKNLLFNLQDPYQRLKMIEKGKKVKGKNFPKRMFNFGLNKMFNVLFYLLDLLGIYVGGQFELYALKK